MKISGKMWIMIILKITKKQGFTLSPEKTFLEKLQGRGGEVLELLELNQKGLLMSLGKVF